MAPKDPTEPGRIADPELGVPGPAEPMPDDDNEVD